MEQTQKIAYLTNALQSSGFLPVLKALWAIFPEPQDTPEYEQWEEAWLGAISYFRDTYSHRLSTEETEEILNNLLTNNQL